MSSLFDNLSEELFQVLKGSGKTLTLYGDDGNKTYEPKKARRVFATPDNIMVSVVEAGSDSEVKLYLSQSTDVRNISKLINTLRQITTRYNVLFNVRKYGRELQPKDFAYQASVTEAAMWGTTKTSYQKFGPTKLIIRHTAPVREGVIGARGRNILSMFVETMQGERFKFPENHLSAGRAFAQHINQGGKPHDEVGTQLALLAQESLALGRVNRYIHHSRNILGEDAVALRTPIKTRIVELRRAFLSMSRPRGYSAIKEAGLPTITNNLCEATSDRLGQLQALLQIDTNHALAESLMPVALLQMGENMTTKNTMFNGVLTLEDAAADALVEALLDEYGHAENTWTRFGSDIAFNEATIYEDAIEALGLLEAGFQINEEDAVSNYATQWTKSRFASAGNTGFDDPKDRREFDKGIVDLTDGIRAILGGQFQTPEFPEHVPGFADANAKARFYLDLYVGQHALANVATLNYVSTIIDKMAEGKKLDGAESTIARKLIDTLEADLNGGEMDESYYAENPYERDDDAAYQAEIEAIIDSFNYDAFIADVLPFVVHDEEKEDPIETKYVMSNLDAYVSDDMENAGWQATRGNFKHEAEELFKTLRPELEQKGYHFDDVVKEFAEMEDKPEHHGISAGDHVSTDMGPATVISIEGDIASVEFLHGGAKEMHVDDMDKIPALNTFGEEAELNKWFEGFNPENVLETDWENSIPERPKAEPTNPNFSKDIVVGDRVTHKAYGSGEVVAANDKLAKVKFDNPHARLPDHKTVSMSKGVLTKAGAYRNEAPVEEADVVSPPPQLALMRAARKARDASKEGFVQHVDDLGNGNFRVSDWMDDSTILSYSNGRCTNGNDPLEAYESVNEAKTSDNTIDACIDLPTGDDIAVTVEFEIEQDDPSVGYTGGIIVGNVIRKDNQHVVHVDQETLSRLEQAIIDELSGREDDRGDYEYDQMRDRRFEESEEVIGGDQGEDLIDDTKVDESFRAELATLLKNAKFRM